MALDSVFAFIRRKTLLTATQSGTPSQQTLPAAPAGQAPPPRVPVDQLSTRFLLSWMFRFLAPVKILVVLAGVYVTLWIAAEVLANRQAGLTVNQINLIQNSGQRQEGLWKWLLSSDINAIALRSEASI